MKTTIRRVTLDDIEVEILGWLDLMEPYYVRIRNLMSREEFEKDLNERCKSIVMHWLSTDGERIPRKYIDAFPVGLLRQCLVNEIAKRLKKLPDYKLVLKDYPWDVKLLYLLLKEVNSYV